MSSANTAPSGGRLSSLAPLDLRSAAGTTCSDTRPHPSQDSMRSVTATHHVSGRRTQALRSALHLNGSVSVPTKRTLARSPAGDMPPACIKGHSKEKNLCNLILHLLRNTTHLWYYLHVYQKSPHGGDPQTPRPEWTLPHTPGPLPGYCRLW